MARYIDAETLKRNVRVNLMPNVDIDGTVSVENAERYFLNLIDKTSIADVAEVVRCEKCKYYIANYCTRDINGRTNMFYMQPTDFCSYGERRTENDL